MGNPLVSVIIPAYNHEKYIEQTLESIINQSYKNIELIVLNDGSTDNTHEKIVGMQSKLNRRFMRCFYINKENEKICKTLNKGLQIARGKYIIGFPSDDVMYPNRIEKQVKYMEENPQYGLIYTDGFNVKSEGRIDLNEVYPEENKFSRIMEFAEGWLLDFMLVNVFEMPTVTICVRKECYDTIGYYDENMNCEDPDMFLRIASTYQIGFIKEPLTIHRIHSTNSAKNFNIVVPTILAMREKYIKCPFLTEKQKEILIKTLRKNL